MEPAPNFGALISREHQRKVLDCIRIGQEEGATLLCGGEALRPAMAPDGFFVAPTIFHGRRGEKRAGSYKQLT
ncbi:aldehyde dehydrogenase family protein, partial [Aeromonas salmonicida]|uniref:aldehyde dehydrogenase family protein n=1 Tax=Aeromonas salmonicida TaxID=645 RepID=UPI003D31FC7A